MIVVEDKCPFENIGMTREEAEILSDGLFGIFRYNEGESVAYTLRSLRYNLDHAEFKQLVKCVHNDRDKLNAWLFQRCFVWKNKAPNPKPKVILKASLDSMDDNEIVCRDAVENSLFIKRFFIQVSSYVHWFNQYKKMMEKYFDVTWED